MSRLISCFDDEFFKLSGKIVDNLGRGLLSRSRRKISPQLRHRTAASLTGCWSRSENRRIFTNPQPENVSRLASRYLTGNTGFDTAPVFDCDVVVLRGIVSDSTS